jgi:hypothetical protein
VRISIELKLYPETAMTYLDNLIPYYRNEENFFKAKELAYLNIEVSKLLPDKPEKQAQALNLAFDTIRSENNLPEMKKLNTEHVKLIEEKNG